MVDSCRECGGLPDAELMDELERLRDQVAKLRALLSVAVFDDHNAICFGPNDPARLNYPCRGCELEVARDALLVETEPMPKQKECTACRWGEQREGSSDRKHTCGTEPKP